MFDEKGLIMDDTEGSGNSQSAASSMGFGDSPDFDFVSLVKPIPFTQNPVSFGSLQSSTNCEIDGSPQPSSYPSRLGLSTNDWNWNVEDDPTPPPNNQDLMPTEPCLQEWSESCGEGNLGGDWDDVMSICRSIMQNRDMFSGGFMEVNPKKKKARLEEGGGSCKRCKCKKSKCLMLYCECFATGVYCVGACECLNCFNNHIHKDKIVAARKEIEWRKPIAFVMRMWDSDLRRSRRRKKGGCSCKKGCHMKYCGCFEGGVGCSSYCRCQGCKNKFGTNSIDLETEQDSQDKTSCHLALEASGDINAVNSPSAVAVSVAAASNVPPPISAAPTTTTTTSSVLADKKAELDQCLPFSAAASPAAYGFQQQKDYYYSDNNLLLANASAFPMASSTQSDFGFADPFMYCGHQTDAAAADVPSWAQFLL